MPIETCFSPTTHTTHLFTSYAHQAQFINRYTHLAHFISPYPNSHSNHHRQKPNSGYFSPARREPPKATNGHRKSAVLYCRTIVGPPPENSQNTCSGPSHTPLSTSSIRFPISRFLRRRSGFKEAISTLFRRPMHVWTPLTLLYTIIKQAACSTYHCGSSSWTANPLVPTAAE